MSEVDGVAERANSRISGARLPRRSFLRGLTVIGGAILGNQIYALNKLFLDKTGRSIREGNILTDMGEVLDSQFEKDERLFLDSEDDYNSEWLKGLFERMSFYKIEGDNFSRIAFLEITNRCSALKTLHIGKDISEAFGQQQTEFMILPTPQNDEQNRYIMFAGFNFDGKTINMSSRGRSPVRGGLVLKDRKVWVGIPGTFLPPHSEVAPYDDEGLEDRTSALVEYFFTLDSDDIEKGLSSLEGIPSLAGKNFRNAEEFSAAIVTFYSRDGKSFQTFVITSYRDMDLKSGEFRPHIIKDYTIPQLVSLAEDFLKREMPNCDRFMIAFPDPGPGQYLAHSQPLSNRELIKKGLEPFRAPIPREMVEQAKYHRILGGNASMSSFFMPFEAHKPAYVVIEAS